MGLGENKKPETDLSKLLGDDGIDIMLLSASECLERAAQLFSWEFYIKRLENEINSEITTITSLINRVAGEKWSQYNQKAPWYVTIESIGHESNQMQSLLMTQAELKSNKSQIEGLSFCINKIAEVYRETARRKQ